MVRFKGESFYRLSQLLSTLSAVHHGSMVGAKMLLEAFEKEFEVPLVRFADPQFLGSPPEEMRASFKTILTRDRAHLANAGLRISIKSLDRFLAAIENPDAAMSEWVDKADELHRIIQDELEDIELWQVSQAQLKYLDTDPFGLIEQNKFASAWRDIEGAGRCVAFDCGTACVFHLMRVMEVGLRALGSSLNNPDLDPKRNPTWETILRKSDDELRKPLKDRSPEWRSDDGFFSTATANLRAVKDAWRNPTLHVERDYTPSDAEDVWTAVRAFMRYLAKKLG